MENNELLVNLTPKNMNIKVIDYTYDWLNTAFSHIPVLDYDGMINKNNAIGELLEEELIEYIFAPNYDEKMNALADIRVVILNCPFYCNIKKEELLEIFKKDYIDLNQGLSEIELFTKLCNYINNRNVQYYNPYNVIDILHITFYLGKYLGKYNNQKGIDRLLKEDVLTYRSNCTKFCLNEEEAKLTVELYATGKHPNKLGEKIETLYEPTGNDIFKYRIVNPKGKIMKSVNFKDVGEFVNEN